jgi:AcrR family transcriptional regulator
VIAVVISVSALDDVQGLYDVQKPSTLSGVTSMETVETTSAPVGRRRPGPRRALTEDEILDAALSLLDRGGPSAASIRGIAAKVGVAPNAVYTYFPDKAAVIKALIERLLSELDHDARATRGQPWRGQVETLALDLRAHLLAHPAAVHLMMGGHLEGLHALALNEWLLELLADAGLDPTEAAREAYLIVVYVFGCLALEVADQHEPGPLPPEAERIATRRIAFSATPADDFPRTAAAADTIAGYISTEQYVRGLRWVLDGIAARAAASLRGDGDGDRDSVVAEETDPSIREAR